MPPISICIICARQYLNTYFSTILIAYFCVICFLQCFLTLFMDFTIRKHLSYFSAYLLFPWGKMQASPPSVRLLLVQLHMPLLLVLWHMVRLPFCFTPPSICSSYIISKCFLSVKIIQLFVCYFYSFYMLLHLPNFSFNFKLSTLNSTFSLYKTLQKETIGFKQLFSKLLL